MAFLRTVTKSLETAGHGIAVGATALADEVTGGRVPELRGARRDQERRLQAAARGAGAGARALGEDLGRAVGTTGVSLQVLARVAAHPEQLRRLVELVEAHDFPGLLRALQRGARFPSDFFPAWIRRAGGYFPKFAQVLSVRADLIHDREVLRQFSRCIEDMPARPAQQVREHLLAQGWEAGLCSGVGDALNAGTVAQVNALAAPGGAAVVKVAWPDTRRQMETDFRLFEHAREILGALRLEDEQARTVAGMFAVVGKSEPAVMREFDMEAEACTLRAAGSLCAAEWEAAYREWLLAAGAALQGVPPQLSLLAAAFVQQQLSSAWRVRVPEPLPGLSCRWAVAMSRAGGESLHKLLSGPGDAAQRHVAAQVLVGFAVPLVGWLLLCKSSSHFAHVDPHPGNFRWDASSRTLWVLDWGSVASLSAERRAALCMIIMLVAHDAEDDAVADVARDFGVRGGDSRQLSLLVRGLLNATTAHAAPDALSAAAVDSVLDDVSEDVAPVIRCLATLGGLLRELQRRVPEELRQRRAPFSLAALWAPFAEVGLRA